MLQGILALIALYALFITVLVMPIAYILAWALGPAVKHLGRKWEEGRQTAIQTMGEYGNREYLRGLDDGQADRARRIAAPVAPVQGNTPTDPNVKEQYSITGRRLR